MKLLSLAYDFLDLLYPARMRIMKKFGVYSKDIDFINEAIKLLRSDKANEFKTALLDEMGNKFSEVKENISRTTDKVKATIRPETHTKLDSIEAFKNIYEDIRYLEEAEDILFEIFKSTENTLEKNIQTRLKKHFKYKQSM